MKKTLFLFSGVVIALGACWAIFYYFSDYQMMQAEMPERRPDIRGVIQSVQNYQVTVTPFNRESSPLKDLSREEVREKMMSLSIEERRAFREKMQQDTLQEITIELPKDLSIYKKTKQMSREVQRFSIPEIKESNIVSIWLEPLQEDGLPTAEFITIFSPEFYDE